METGLNASACVGKLQPIECSVEAAATMIGCLPTQAIAFGWKPGFTVVNVPCGSQPRIFAGLATPKCFIYIYYYLYSNGQQCF